MWIMAWVLGCPRSPVLNGLTGASGFSIWIGTPKFFCTIFASRSRGMMGLLIQFIVLTRWNTSQELKGRSYSGSALEFCGGGVIRIVVPDFLWIVREYLDGHITAEHFLEKLGVLYGEELNGVKKTFAPFVSFPHKCMYNLRSLRSALDDAGFQAEEKAPFESRIPDIEQIEQKGRTEKAVIVEGVKP